MPTNRQLVREQLNRWFILIGLVGIFTTIIDPLSHWIYTVFLTFQTGLLTYLVLKTTKHQNIGRNQPCPCGSGIKYKKCCFPKTSFG